MADEQPDLGEVTFAVASQAAAGLAALLVDAIAVQCDVMIIVKPRRTLDEEDLEEGATVVGCTVDTPDPEQRMRDTIAEAFEMVHTQEISGATSFEFRTGPDGDPSNN